MEEVKAYQIYDRRTQDQIDERTLDEAITKHIGGVENIALETYDDHFKLKMLHEAGFTVTRLQPIEFLESGSPIRGTDKIEAHAQLDFNFPDRSYEFDFHMEEYAGERYLCVQFFGNEGNMERMFDNFGNEKVLEGCGNCGEEVVIDAIQFKVQKCPSCTEPIKACCLCSEDDMKDCSACDIKFK